MTRFQYQFVTLLLFSAFATTACPAPTLSQQRNLFLRAEKAFAKNRRAEFLHLLPSLHGYPLYPQLVSHQLSGDLDNDQAIESFLNHYGWSRAAAQLRRSWMEHLANQGEWTRFFDHYRNTDEKGLRCLYHYGQIRTGHSEEGYAGGEALWLSGNSLPETCDTLFHALKNAGHLTRNKVWRRFQLALQHKKPQLAADIESYMSSEDRQAAAFWLKVHEHPRMALNCGNWPVAGSLGGKIYVHALDRLASHEVLLARSLWHKRRARFEISQEDADYMERRLALALALSRHPDAYAALEALPAQQDDEEVRAWRVRSALLAQDWRTVLSAWQRLDDAEKTQPEWRYWQARALEQLGDQQAAGEAYGLAAKQRDFFGFLAADHIDAQYHTAHTPAPVSTADLQHLADSPAFRAVHEWHVLDRSGEAYAEWFHALKSLSQHDMAVAAKLAQQWGWNSIAITTAARAELWDDLSIRFPLAYENSVRRHANRQQVDPGMVYGLIRQESAFDRNAKSPVGASGLMQIMPSTAKSIAKLLREKLFSASLLSDPDTNVRYGTFYFRDLLERFSSNFAMAAAAYNAGPHRVNEWLPTSGSVPSDIWVEQIPFKETRHYVSTVLSNAVIYQERLGGETKKRRIGQLLPEVPAGRASSDNDERSAGCP